MSDGAEFAPSITSGVWRCDLAQILFPELPPDINGRVDVLECHEVGQILRPMFRFGLEFAAQLGKAVDHKWKTNSVIQCMVELQHECSPPRCLADMKSNRYSPKVTSDTDGVMEVIVPGRRVAY